VCGEWEELDWELAGVGAEDETAFVEIDEAEQESSSTTDGVKGGLMCAVGGERVVVAIENGDGSGGDERVHGGGLLSVGADGEEALPVGVFGGGAGTVVVQARGGDLDGFDNGGGGDAGLVHSRGGGDDGDDLGWVAGVDGGLRGGEVEREELVDGDVLRGEDSVQAFEGERAFAIEIIRDMRLLKSSLLGEAASGEGPAFDASKEFDAEEFMQILKVHEKGVSQGEPYHSTRRR